MNSGFHIDNLSLNRKLTTYQPRRSRTIAAWLTLLTCALPLLCASAQPAGFAPSSQNLLTPLLTLAPCGQAEQALQAFERIHRLDRAIMLHPLLSSQFQSLLEKLPPPEIIPIEMPSLYGRSDLPWHSEADAHWIGVSGRPDGDAYLLDLSDRADPPQEPQRMTAEMRLTPVENAAVAAELKASLYLSSATAPRSGLAAALGFEREIYGTLAPPWDRTPGVFNQHDRSALARLRRDLPATTRLLEHYLEFHNLLDEFDGRSGPLVLFNLDATVKEQALAPYPHLLHFWREVAGRIQAQTVIHDTTGQPWIISRLDRGRILLSFALSDAALVPVDLSQPESEPIEQLSGGRFYQDSAITMSRFGMRFGLDRIRLVTEYANRGGAISFDTRMAGVPRLIAPPLIHPLTMFIAGDFLKTAATGSGGLRTSFEARPGPQGGTTVSAGVSAELRQAAALAAIARMAAAFAPGYGAEVRAEQRRLAREFFDAFDSDYRRSRPTLLHTR